MGSVSLLGSVFPLGSVSPLVSRQWEDQRPRRSDVIGADGKDAGSRIKSGMTAASNEGGVQVLTRQPNRHSGRSSDVDN